jgi:hypothetical protein
MDTLITRVYLEEIMGLQGMIRKSKIAGDQGNAASSDSVGTVGLIRTVGLQV